MAYGLIYKITNKLNRMPYVGKTTRSLEVRFKEHTKADSYIGRAIRKYGEENFLCEVIEECETPEQLNEREIFWIAFFNCKQPNGYNQTDGGDGAMDQFGEKNHFFGKHHTEETKAILRERQRERALRGENKTFLGHHHTEESKAELSVSHRAETPYKNLLDEMDKRQFTYTALAKLMGSTQPAFSMKMRDQRQFTDNDVAKLVEIFGLPAEYLLARDDGQPTIITSRKGEKNPFFGKRHTDETRMESAKNNRGDTPYKNLLAEMDKRQISYRMLATLLGIGNASISRKMTGVRNFTEIEWAKLSEIFGLPVEYLMECTDGSEAKPSNRYKTPYKNLLKEMTDRKLTYTALGELLGLCHQSVSEKMHGKKNFTAKDIAKLVEIFGKPAEYLMARED